MTKLFSQGVDPVFQNLFGQQLIFIVIALPISLVLHEFSHALIATVLGDPTPRQQGRLTLNPMAHLEILGLLMMFFGPIGWARPVQVNPRNFRHPALGMAIVAAAGPATNFVLACLLLLLFRAVGQDMNAFLDELVGIAAIVNLNLCIFNLIPIPPLDGSRIVNFFLPARQRLWFSRMDMYGPFLLLIAFLLPPIRNDLFLPLFSWFQNVVAGMFGLQL